MKKNWRIFIAFLAMIAMAVFSVSCGDDDDDDSGNSSYYGNLEGTWSLVKVRTYSDMNVSIKNMDNLEYTEENENDVFYYFLPDDIMYNVWIEDSDELVVWKNKISVTKNTFSLDKPLAISSIHYDYDAYSKQPSEILDIVTSTHLDEDDTYFWMIENLTYEYAIKGNYLYVTEGDLRGFVYIFERK